MIHQNPPDELLRSAHRIAFFDPREPAWYALIVDQIPISQYTGKQYSVVDIPVDSSKPDEVQAWRDRIAQVRGLN